MKVVDGMFQTAGLSKEGYEEIYARVETLMGETEAELSVLHATGVITFKQRIEKYDSQKDDLVKELIELKSGQHGPECLNDPECRHGKAAQ